MVTITGLWLPILLSGLAVWIASALVWTVMPHRRNEFRQLPDEEAVRRALRGAPGEYAVPFGGDSQAMKDPAYLKKYEEGPVAIIRLMPAKKPAMGKPMVLAFVGYLVLGLVVAYLTSRTLPAGTEYLQVFRVAATIAWAAHFFGALPDSIWFGKPWGSTWKLCVEALVYGCLTGGFFGWLWPS